MYTDIKLNKNLFNKSTGAVLAVSGGPDSMAMLDIFRQSDLDIKFVCATFNHGLRQESDNEVNGVKTYCSEFGIPFETEKENIKDTLPAGTSVEEHARNRRYAFLERIKLKYGFSNIVTAHNADDNAESVLMNLTRGCGLDGLCGIRVYREDNGTIRPLLKYTKQELLDYCHINGVPYWIDNSNYNTDFRRNYFRHNVIPLFKEINPMFISSVSNTSSYIEADCDFLKQESQKAFETVCDEIGLRIEALKELHPAISTRVLRIFLKKETGKNPNHIDTETVSKLIHTGKTSDKCELYGKIFRLTYMHLTTNQILINEGFDNIGLNPDKTVLPYGILSIVHKKNYNGEYNCVKPFDTNSAIVRSRKQGDYMHTPQGSGKTLKQLFTDKKIPAELRYTIPVITLGNKIIWVYEIGTDKDALPNKDEDYFQIEYTKLKEN